MIPPFPKQALGWAAFPAGKGITEQGLNWMNNAFLVIVIHYIKEIHASLHGHK
jgi:hypothetical protein